MSSNDHTTKLSFSFALHRRYDEILSLKVEGEIVPEGEAAIPYLMERISSELVRVTGLKLPGIEEADRGE